MKIIVVVLIVIAILYVIMQPKAKLETTSNNERSAKMILSDQASRDTITGTLFPEMESWIIKTFGENAKKIIGTIKTSGKIYVPAVGLMESFSSKVSSPEEAKPVKISDFEYGVHMVKIAAPDGREVGQAAGYTELELLNNKEFIQERNAKEWLTEILAMPESEGVVINPKTRFMRDDVSDFYTTTNKFGVAELIGMLEINEVPDGITYHQLCNEAFSRGEYYKVLYYWSNSYKNSRSGDNWKLCEISKLKSYYALDFPGSKARSVSELDWMLQNHPNPEILEYAKTAPR